ncbi:nucleotide exchange factor GrpE [Virgibacillus halodenitrificans]|uniref:nucleotide exchange factor GrpE n=1 Tax=Virgibacillus halodenitrificans TaxID=1482 RepID=UPI002DC0390B|nr:nucleotide exchange factor GrpE [Virgibacillus halodenitrificans]MEC2160045.1 nucleotide exchange factor GrpE [Virgibacillus halodenitrificans]
MEEQGNTNENEKNHEDGKVKVLDAEQEGKDTADEQLKLQEENEALKKEKDEVFQRMLRVQAEFDNFKKRSQREKEADRKYKSQDLVNELLPAVDNFERALQVETTEDNAGFVEGITMVYRQIKEALKSQGVEEIDSVDKEFDPNLHHAVMQVEEEDKEPNIIVEELQKGYVLKDRVIRPAMVKVNK